MIVIACAFSLSLVGQTNLVPNPSFEIIDTCPYNQEQVHFATPWFDLCATPDLYNTCAVTANNAVPLNWTGYQWPRTGNGYAGISLFNFYNNSNAEIREYISTPLLDTLEAGKKYCVEFYVSKPNYSYYAVNRIGLYFSNTTMIPDNMGDTIDVQPQIEWDSTQMLLDTTDWIRVSGVYLAGGGEMYIAIGNFYSDAATDTLGQLGSYIWGYYYIDDVAVYELQEPEAGADVSICYKDSAQLGVPAQPNVYYTWFPSEGISDVNSSNPKASPDSTTTFILMQYECDVLTRDTVTVIVNRDCHSAPEIIIPTILFGNQQFFITGLESNSRLDLYDIRGRLVYASSDYQNDYWPLSLEQGIYVACLTRPTGEQIVKRVCILR